MRALILMISVLTSLGSAKAEPAIEAYYKGLVAEKVAGERDQAVALYREVVERYLKGDARIRSGSALGTIFSGWVQR